MRYDETMDGCVGSPGHADHYAAGSAGRGGDQDI